MICFESAFGYQVRPLVRDGAEVIVVSTNNRSYRRSANSAQHVAIGQMRAAETGRPVVQAAISGISALIDASGEVQAETELFERTRAGRHRRPRCGARRSTCASATGSCGRRCSPVLALFVVCIVRRRRGSVDSSGPAPAVPATSPPGPTSTEPAAIGLAGRRPRMTQPRAIDRAIDVVLFAPLGAGLYVARRRAQRRGDVRRARPGRSRPPPRADRPPRHDRPQHRPGRARVRAAEGAQARERGCSRAHTDAAPRPAPASRAGRRAAADAHPAPPASSPRPASCDPGPERSTSASAPTSTSAAASEPAPASAELPIPATTRCRRRRSSNGSRASSAPELDAVRAYEARIATGAPSSARSNSSRLRARDGSGAGRDRGRHPAARRARASSCATSCA